MKLLLQVFTLVVLTSLFLGCSETSNAEVANTDMTVDARTDDAGTNETDLASDFARPINNGTIITELCSTDEECQQDFAQLEGGNDGPYDASSLECKIDRFGTTRCIECLTDEDCPDEYRCNFLCYPVKQPCVVSDDCPDGYYCVDQERCLQVERLDAGSDSGEDMGNDGM